MTPATPDINVPAHAAPGSDFAPNGSPEQTPPVLLNQVPARTGGRRMSFDPAESTLTTGDYRRLGVRESEARARVIRHAAHQLAEPLVRRHLAAPNGQTESDLVEVVISTYRLLDPRRRTTAVERALLTQLEPVRPVEARWSHPKASEHRKPAATDGTRFDAVRFESIPADSSSLFPEPSPPRSINSLLAVAQRQIAAYQPLLMRYRHGGGRGKWAIWMVPALLALLLIPLLPLLGRGDPKASSSVPGANTVEASTVTPPLESEPQPATPNKPPSKKPTRSPARPIGGRGAIIPPHERLLHTETSEGTASTGRTLPIKLTPIEATRPDVDSAESTPSAASISSTTNGPSPLEKIAADAPARSEPSPNEQEEASEPEASEPEDRDGSQSINDRSTDQPATTKREEPADAFIAAQEPSAPADGVASVASPAAISNGDREIAGATPRVSTEPLAAPPRRAPLPSSAELQASRARLQKLTADRPEAVTEAQQMREVEWLLDLRKESPPDSADALAIAQLAVAKLVAAGHCRQAAAIIDELEGLFDAEDSQLGCSTTEQLLESAGSLADHRHIVAWCLALSEQYLRTELFDGASEMTRLGTIAAVKLGDAELRARLSQRRDAVSTARRTSESVWQIAANSSPETATATDATQAGRYLCLMIRDWEQGVPWLATSSDARLAAAAQQELRLRTATDEPFEAKENQPTVDGGTIAKAWLEASDRFRGRLGESAKLHAYELTKQAMEESAGLRTLELKKQLDALREELPEDLIPTEEKVTPTADRRAGAAGGQPAGAGDSGVMEGRLTLAGRDTGTLIRYSPGVQLRQGVIEQIFRALQKPVAPWTLTFEGVLRLEKPATVRFIAAGPTAPDGDTAVRVNNNRLTLAESVRGHSAAIDLAAGFHRVTWQISGSNLEEAFVLLQDEVSGDRLELAAPPADRNSLPVRLHINIQRAP